MQAIGKIVKKFERLAHHRFARYTENIAVVSESVTKDLNVRISCLSQLNSHEQQAVDDNFSNKIFFNDEVPFTIGGYVNKQNFRI